MFESASAVYVKHWFNMVCAWDANLPADFSSDKPLYKAKVIDEVENRGVGLSGATWLASSKDADNDFLCVGVEGYAFLGLFHMNLSAVACQSNGNRGMRKPRQSSKVVGLSEIRRVNSPKAAAMLAVDLPTNQPVVDSVRSSHPPSSSETAISTAEGRTRV